MPPVQRIWQIQPVQEHAQQRLAQEAKISLISAQLLLNRGVRTAGEANLFLHTPMKGLHSPQLMPGIPEAAEQIITAIHSKKSICIYGDYDVDGTTGTAILLQLLQKLGATVRFYVPNRLEEGYGLNSGAIRELVEQNVEMLITVDCGIASVNEASLAKDLGLQLIITDHHEMKAELPDAAVLVHPRLPGTQYPFDGLSGSCVAFKLAWAIAQQASGKQQVTSELREFLLDAMGLAALGLIADVVPLRDENRIFVKHGLARIVQKPSLGLQALCETAKITKELRAEDVAFRIAPRLNAAGRLGCARLVVELLTTNSANRATEIAEFLDTQNTKRQFLEKKITADAKQMVEDSGYGDDPAIVLGSTEWHGGVIGIVAGRLAEYFAKPVLICALQEHDQPSSGSGRSIAGFALHEALKACDDVLVTHGGHSAAAGFRVLPSRLDELRQKFCQHVPSIFPEGPPPPVLRLDAEVPLNSLNMRLLREIDSLEPYGAENPRPVFVASQLQIEGTPRRIGNGERHLSFRVRQNDTTLRAVAFGLGDQLDDLMSNNGQCSLAFTPVVNDWQGYTSVEIQVKDFQPQIIPKLG